MFDDVDLRQSAERDILKMSIIKATGSSKIDWKQVKQKVQQGDITYTIALAIAKEEIEDLKNAQINKETNYHRALYDQTWFLRIILLMVYLSVAFVQKPNWCNGLPVVDPETNTYYSDCSGTAKEGSVIPVSGLPYLENWQLSILELFCVTTLTVLKYVKAKLNSDQIGNDIKILVVLAALAYVADFLQYVVGILFPFNAMIRLIYFITYNKSIRKNMRFYVKLFWASKEIFIVIGGAIIFFVSVARLLFYETPMNQSGAQFFDTYMDTLYNLFVSLTSSNYPDVMMPIYEEERLSSLFFIIYMAICHFILLNIVSAYFYYNYKTELMKEVEEFGKTRTVADAMIELAKEEENKQLIQNAGQGLKHQSLDLLQQRHQEEMKKLFGGSQFKRRLLESLSSRSMQNILAFFSLLSFVLIILQSNYVSPDPQSSYTKDEVEFDSAFNTAFLFIEGALNFFLALDPILRFISLKWHYFKREAFDVYELICSLVLVPLITIRIFDADLIDILLIKWLLCTRIIRFLRWVNTFEKYNLIFSTLYKLVPLFVDLLGILFVAFYFYSAMGDYLFGGQIKTNININFQEYGDPNYFVYVNFNDFYMGFFTCFHLMIVNNWLYTVDVHCRVMGSFAYRLFFVSYYVIVVMVCLNILLAFTIDLYVTQMSNHFEDQENQKHPLSRKDSIEFSKDSKKDLE